MKCSQLLRILKKRWLVCGISKRFARKNATRNEIGKIIFPNHGSQEMGKGLEKKILKDARIK